MVPVVHIGRKRNSRKLGYVKGCADDVARVRWCIVANGVIVNHQKTGAVHAQAVLIVVPQSIVNIPYSILIAGNLHRPPRRE